MSVDQRDLVKCVRKYRALDDELKEINTRTYKLRDDKKVVETEMSDILRRANFQTLNKLEIQDDGSYIKIQRPDTWNKPWSLSQKELKDLLSTYFTRETSSAPASSDNLFKWIVDRKKQDMVAHEFSFTRVRAVTDNNDDEDIGVGERARA